MDSPGGVSGKAAPPFAQKRGGEGKGVGRCIYSAVAFLLYRQEEGRGGEEGFGEPPNGKRRAKL